MTQGRIAEGRQAVIPQSAPVVPAATPISRPVEHLTGAASVVRSLEEAGAEVVFGIPGGAVLPVYDPLLDSTKVRHVLVRHEQGAGHAATGYAQATGKVGVCMATSGPGATNLVTPIADAQMDSVPMVAITGQVGRSMIGTDGFQEADICGITMPITKHNFLVTDPASIPQTIAAAFHLAATGRPGVVLVDIPKDVLQSETTFVWPQDVHLPGYRPTMRPHSGQITAAAKLIAAARRPVLYVGGGVLKARATEVLRQLAELTGIPVVTTLMARGAFPDSHIQHIGMPGMHGTVTAVAGMQRADVIVALGARFDDRVTGQLSTFAPGATVIHADIDPAEIGKNRVADVPIVGDAREVISELITAVSAEQAAGVVADLTAWWAELDELRSNVPARLRLAVGRFAVPAVRHRTPRRDRRSGCDLRRRSRSAPDVGGPVHFLREARNMAQLGGLGTMGTRCRPRWVPDGPARRGRVGDRRRRLFPDDEQELATCAIEGIPIKVAVINNGDLGMVRQWQTLFYGERYTHTELGTHKHRIPDFQLLAEAYGCLGCGASPARTSIGRSRPRWP